MLQYVIEECIYEIFELNAVGKFGLVCHKERAREGQGENRTTTWQLMQIVVEGDMYDIKNTYLVLPRI